MLRSGRKIEKCNLGFKIQNSNLKSETWNLKSKVWGLDFRIWSFTDIPRKKLNQVLSLRLTNVE